MPDYPLSYSLQSRSRELMSYTDAPAHTGPKLSDNFIVIIILNIWLDAVIIIIIIEGLSLLTQ